LKKKEILDRLNLIKYKLSQLYINRNIDFDIDLIKELNQETNNLIKLYSKTVKLPHFIKKDDNTPSLLDRIKDRLDESNKENIQTEAHVEMKKEKPKTLLNRIADRIENMEVHHYEKNEDPPSLMDRIKNKIEKIEKEPVIEKPSDDPKSLLGRIKDKMEHEQSNKGLPPVNIYTVADANSDIEVKLASAIIQEKRNNDFSKLASYHKYYYLNTMIKNIDNAIKSIEA
jgi:hypothetical protein